MASASVFPDVKAWPDAPKRDGAAPMGDNRPPPEEMARDEFNNALDAALRKRSLTRGRFDELTDQATRAVAIDDETVGLCGELVKSLRAGMKLVDEIHADIKAPYLKAGRELDGMKSTLLQPLEEAKRLVERKQTTYLTEQENLRQAELRRHREAEAARLREEEAKRLAETPADQFLADAGREAAPVTAAAPVQSEPIRGAFGAAVSGQKVWVGEVTDYTVAFIAVQDNEKVREAIDKAVAGMVRAGSRQIEGVRIHQTLKASNR